MQPALQRMLLAGESVFYIARCVSPLNLVEQLTLTWYTQVLAAAAIVVTNQRVLFFPVKRDGSWRESTRAVNWGDVTEVKKSGWLVQYCTFRYKNGSKERYSALRHGDGKKLAAIAAALIPASTAEVSASQGPVPLCPDCKGVLTPKVYTCPTCGLVFKNEKTMIQRSILLPGGGYFYTGHPFVALLPAVVEIFLILDILALLLGGSQDPAAREALPGLLLFFAVVWVLETGVTILHCRRYVREFIPEKRDPSRAAQYAVSAK